MTCPSVFTECLLLIVSLMFDVLDSFWRPCLVVMKTEAIKNFLLNRTHPDLAALYNYDMEVQVNVARENGRKIDGDYKGAKWSAWTDDINTWKPFRIPRNAATEPEFTDSPISYDLGKYAEGIGMTGWDWKRKLSRWVAYDFDAITGHSINHLKKLTDEQLLEVRNSVSSIPWVTIRHSTSGSGLHLYVFLAEPVITNTHTEHAALARSILGLMSAATGLDLQAKIDACGQNMWVWHRKMKGTDGLKIIKSGEKLDRIPINWKEHMEVVAGRRRKTVPMFIKEAIGDDYESIFAELTGQRSTTQLDSDHLKLIKFMDDQDYQSWWDNDHHMLVTHTYALRMAHVELQLKGIYETLSTGTEIEHNCFAFPMRNGSWVIRRYTRGTAESPTWDQDRNGWTRCYYNRLPDLETVVKSAGAIENSKGAYVFSESEMAAKAMANLGVDIQLHKTATCRPATVKPLKEGKVLVQIEHSSHDKPEYFPGFILEKTKWSKVVVPKSPPPSENEVGNFDDTVRHLISETNEDCGWVLKTGNNGNWRMEPISHITLALASMGCLMDEIRTIQGASVISCWNLVNKPFESEYPGDRQWNRDAAQFKYAPTLEKDNLRYPTWTSILEHCGAGLTEFLPKCKWAVDNNITTGGQYLFHWVASVFQKPTEPLPYLFFYSKEQNTGKSIFHEALELLVTPGAVVRADLALGDTQFNGELAGAVICIIEETDLKKSKSAYNKIKDWVTSKHINIRKLYETPYSAVNTTHWIQCSNNQDGVPIFPGDTRITMLNVQPLEPDTIVPKGQLITKLVKEAPDFLAALLTLELPDPTERLAIPTIVTADKLDAEESNKSILELFVDTHIAYCPGYYVTLSNFYNKFLTDMNVDNTSIWTKQRITRDLDRNLYPKGRSTKDNSVIIGNMVFRDIKDPNWVCPEPKTKYIIVEGQLLIEGTKSSVHQ